VAQLPAGLLTPAPPPRPGLLGRHRKKLIALGVLLAAPAAAHLGITAGTRIEPPPIAAVEGEPVEAPGGLRVLGRGYARPRGKILEVRLAGTPEEIGHQHGRLLYREMVHNEGTLYAQFEHHVPFAPLRWLIMDLSRLRFQEVDGGMQPERRREIAAQARAFAPDPFEGVLPTYHRFVFLHSLYDIALSFEHSPLIGCTSFALTDGAFAGGHAVLARAFDFEAGPVFDEGKAVFLMHEEGRIPYASVAWPGLVGAVSGMNAEGLAAVVHGELATLAPFGSADGIVARAAARLTLVTRGVDPKSVSVPEVGHYELAEDYRASADAAGLTLAAEVEPGLRGRQQRQAQR